MVRPGGMHKLMSFIGCIGILMNGTGLEEIMNASFNGVPNMRNGKAWPKAIRALRMVVAALLQPIIDSGKTTPADIEEALHKAQMPRIGRLWVDCLILPVFIIHLYIRAER